MQLVDSSGRVVTIEKEEFRGGEGTIHPVVGRPDIFAKLYHESITPLKQAKLAAMTGSTDESLLRVAAFQIRGSDRTFHCVVGMPEFTPPELQNRVLANIERTPQHDGFGLAVLCFQLLFMGRHPFAGRFLGRGEMPIERAIAEGRFAFGRDRGARLMEPPPNMVAFESLPPSLMTLFEAAFGEGVRPSSKARHSPAGSRRPRLPVASPPDGARTPTARRS